MPTPDRPAFDAPPAQPPARLREQQFELTRHLRDPQHSPAPPGIEERRLAVYRELLFNNLAGLLAGSFPVIRRLLDDSAWRTLVRDFYREHRCRSPLFTRIAGEFTDYLAQAPLHERDLPAFLPELAHYEWVELALQIDESTAPAPWTPGDDEDLVDTGLALSPLAWPLAYRWPVHRIGPNHRPDTPPDTPTLLLVRREPDGNVRFSELSPLAFRLLQLLEAGPGATGRTLLLALAVEAGSDDAATFVAHGVPLLRQMQTSGVLTAGPRAD